MRWLLNLSIKYKILSILVVGITGFAAYLIFNSYIATTNSLRLNQMRDNQMPMLAKIESNMYLFSQLQGTFSSAAATADEDMVYEAQSIYDNSMENFTVITDLASPIDNDGILKMQIDSLKDTFKLYYDDSTKLTLGFIQGTVDMASSSEKAQQVSESASAYQALLNGFHEYVKTSYMNTIASAEISSRYSLYLGIAIGLVLLILMGGIGIFVAYNVTGNINNVVATLRELAAGEGDLRQRLKSSQQDEIGNLVREFNAFIGKLQGMMKEIIAGMGKLTESAEQMALVTEQSNQGIRQQQSDVEQVATAMNEISATVQEVARNTSQAANGAREASEEADKGKTVVTQAVESINSLATEIENAAVVIHRLEEDSENIGAVLDVIKAIAEQTNLLALNAAIEAARAGEQGRGFAVVADEVRTLAQRTQQSTQEIQEIIEKLQSGALEAVRVMEQSQEKTRDSVEQSSKAGESLMSITEMVSRINDMSNQIASAVEEQSAVTEEVNCSVVTISQVSEQTAQNSQQIAVSSEEMKSLTGQLHNLVSKFKV